MLPDRPPTQTTCSKHNQLGTCEHDKLSPGTPRPHRLCHHSEQRPQLLDHETSVHRHRFCCRPANHSRDSIGNLSRRVLHCRYEFHSSALGILSHRRQELQNLSAEGSDLHRRSCRRPATGPNPPRRNPHCSAPTCKISSLHATRCIHVLQTIVGCPPNVHVEMSQHRKLHCSPASQSNPTKHSRVDTFAPHSCVTAASGQRNPVHHAAKGLLLHGREL
mmetsp:Transcript_55760/g.99290  ORF Transcript_55760/g.99290 Transcript_55760/m.99290 type:complete len:219 (-) Transcript_55760:415-1071(-)